MKFSDYREDVLKGVGGCYFAYHAFIQVIFQEFQSKVLCVCVTVTLMVESVVHCRQVYLPSVE